MWGTRPRASPARRALPPEGMHLQEARRLPLTKGQHWAGAQVVGLRGTDSGPVPTARGARLAGPRISVSTWQPPCPWQHTHTAAFHTENREDVGGPSLVRTHPLGSQVPGPPPKHPAQPRAAPGGPVPHLQPRPGRLGAYRGHTCNYSGPDYSTTPRLAAQVTRVGGSLGELTQQSLG